MANNSSSSSGIGFTGLLAVAFIVLKLTHVIDWSWWWITCPLWGGVAIALAVFLIWLGFKIPSEIIKSRKQKQRLADIKSGKLKIEPKKSGFQQRMEQMMDEKRNQQK